MIEDEMAGWHHLLDGYEFVQTPIASEGQGRLPTAALGVAELDMT